MPLVIGLDIDRSVYVGDIEVRLAYHDKTAGVAVLAWTDTEGREHSDPLSADEPFKLIVGDDICTMIYADRQPGGGAGRCALVFDAPRSVRIQRDAHYVKESNAVA